MPAPTYVLIADLSSLVILPPGIGSRRRLLNPRSAVSVKTETPKFRIWNGEHRSSKNTRRNHTRPLTLSARQTRMPRKQIHPQINADSKLPRVPARSLLYVDHSHRPVLAPAALPSTRAIPDRDA